MDKLLTSLKTSTCVTNLPKKNVPVTFKETKGRSPFFYYVIMTHLWISMYDFTTST